MLTILCVCMSSIKVMRKKSAEKTMPLAHAAIGLREFTARLMHAYLRFQIRSCNFGFPFRLTYVRSLSFARMMDTLCPSDGSEYWLAFHFLPGLMNFFTTTIHLLFGHSP